MGDTTDLIAHPSAAARRTLVGACGMRRGKAVVEGRPEASEHGSGVGGGGGQRLARLRGRRDVALAVPHHIGLANLARVAPRPPSGGLLPVVELLLGRRVGVGVGVGVEVLRRVHPLGLAQHAIPAGCLRRVRERRVQTALLLLLLLLMVLLSVLLRVLLLVVGSARAPWLRGRVLCAVAASRTRGALLAGSHRVVPHGASTMRRSPAMHPCRATVISISNPRTRIQFVDPTQDRSRTRESLL